MPLPLSALEQHDEFIGRHIGPCATEMSQMLAASAPPASTS
jgi:glycine dehydrogenase